jgi:hypothetical protein
MTRNWWFLRHCRAFWYHFQLPETKEALQLMADFFDKKVGH